MSTRYPGGVITKTPVVPAGPYENGTAPGIWTLDQQLQAAKAGIWPTAGNIDPGQFIENIFSTYLYTGTGATQTITNGIDLSTKGGLVWFKCRTNAYGNYLFDTLQGATKYLTSNSSGSQLTNATSLTAFNTTGFTMGSATIINGTNTPAETFASWTFREQPKFFDIVTYTGDGTNNRAISHNLGSTPGTVIVKCTSAAAAWPVWHRSLAGSNYNMYLNSTIASAAQGDFSSDGSASITSTTFPVSNGGLANTASATYVAYLFAHDAGGFGLTGTDNVISCGSFTTDGSGNATVSLGYEPQWILTKRTDAAQSWEVCDNMRAMSVTNRAVLYPNNSDAEYVTTFSLNAPTATGFNISGYGASRSFIYIAIRRGPMQVPTSGTSVFTTLGSTAPSPPSWHSTNFPVDLGFWKNKINASGNWNWGDRLRGGRVLNSNNTDAEVTNSQYAFDYQEGWYYGSTLGDNYPSWMFRRAPGFFDVVCYTGTGVARTVTHNLAAVPELIITKNRTQVTNWNTYTPSPSSNKRLFLENNSALDTSAAIWNGTAPTSSVFSVSSSANISPDNYVAYLFATCPGVSKVGSYTGTGTTQVINCGFTSGSRFVLIKRTDDIGDWYVWDSARGIVAGNDPYLLLNTTDAEVTGTDYVDTAASGFEISSTAPAAINANGGSFIFFAVA